MVDPATALLIFCGLCTVLAGLLWPTRGLVPRWLRMSQLGERVRLEDALKHVLTCRQAGQGCSVDSVAGRLGLSPARATALLSSLARMGLIRMEPDGPALTREGSRSAVSLVRTHRLWERYLADRTGVPAAEWHEQAERMEHTLSPEQTDALEVRLGHPNWDPHGDPIPDASGELPPAPGVSLAEVDPGCTVEIGPPGGRAARDVRRVARRRPRPRRPAGGARAGRRRHPGPRRRTRVDAGPRREPQRQRAEARRG